MSLLLPEYPVSFSSDEKLRIIGVGSPFGADALGLQAVERLQQEPRLSALPYQLEYVALDRPGSALLTQFEEAGVIMLIDAMLSEQSAGTVQRLATEMLVRQGALPSSHSLGVAETLALAEALGVLPRELFIYGIEVSEAVSPAISPALWYEPLLSLLLSDINSLAELS